MWKPVDFQLVERLADSICQLVVRDFAVAEVALVLNKKGALSDAADVGVRIRRRHEDYGVEG
jgi:7,8-dihydroneopterin aldolase/epimerase/oxygenase